jgi:hypothetical protein
VTEYVLPEEFAPYFSDEPLPFSVLQRLEFDVANEARDDHGRWTSGSDDEVKAALADQVKAIREARASNSLNPAIAFTTGCSEAAWGRITGGPIRLNIPAVMDYTGSKYDAINGYLRETERTDPKYAAPTVASLDDVCRWNKLNEDTTVIRGIAVPEELADSELQPGSRYSDPGYSSTSLDAQTALDFARSNAGNHDAGDSVPVALAMHLPAGTNGFPGTAYEREWVLPRGSSFEVLTNDVGSDGTRYVTARYIPPSGYN